MATEQTVEIAEKIAVPTIDNEQIRATDVEITTMEKIGALIRVLNEDLLGCDAKWTLFVSAAQSYRFLTQLEPFPPQFLTDYETPYGMNIDGLVRIINETPRLHSFLIVLKESKPEDINPGVLDLVHWVLVVKYYPFLRKISSQEFSQIMQSMGNTVTNNEESTQAFMVIHEKDSPCDLELEKAINSYSTVFAFYGSQLDTIYSLLSTGFKKYHNPNNNFIGRMLELYPTLEKCVHKSPAAAAWGFSSCGSILSCIGICEYINNPHFVQMKTTQDDEGVQHLEKILISNSDLVRLRYILLYGNRTTDEIVQDPKTKEKNWIKRNKNLLSVTLSLVFVVTALTSTKHGTSITNFCSRNFGKVFTLCSSSLNFGVFNKFK